MKVGWDQRVYSRRPTIRQTTLGGSALAVSLSHPTRGFDHAQLPSILRSRWYVFFHVCHSPAAANSDDRSRAILSSSGHQNRSAEASIRDRGDCLATRSLAYDLD